MAEKPILFNTEMVIAILDGRKTMTRRAVKPQPNGEIKANIPYEFYGSKTERIFTDTKAYLAPYSVGDVLWVRETWADNIPGCPNGITYKADHLDPKGDGPANPIKWKPSIHMPKSAARIWLTVTDVRVERLQEIATDDAKAEGVLQPGVIPSNTLIRNTEGSIPRTNFKILWDSLNASRGFSWEQNPWVWVISFEREG
jgi:hypothetical protein